VAEKSSAGKACRIPPEAGGIQVNFCKNPSCANDGVPARLSIRRGGTGGGKVQDGYALRDVEIFNLHDFPPIKNSY
jgi:hypothetical protein